MKSDESIGGEEERGEPMMMLVSLDRPLYDQVSLVMG